MLLQALKANKEEPKQAAEVVAAHRRRTGKKLALSEY